ncbi:hypothetical protein [Candidatus Spongiihabitans sp.]|uniref:hypothetical protein n=1 Tax=Candidatus Spongiihabitans sp. TaxID=3101308 RepID=UPI003C7E0698
MIGSAVIALPKEHLLAQALEKAGRGHTKVFPWENSSDRKKKLKKRLLRRGKEGMEFNNPIAPGGLTKAIKYFGLENHAKPFMYFYPIYFGHWRCAFDDSYREGVEFYKNTYGIHLWNEMAHRTPGFNKNARFDQGSLFEQLKKKHGIAPVENAPKISSAKLQSILASERMTKKRNRRVQRMSVALVLAAAVVAGWIVGRQ